MLSKAHTKYIQSLHHKKFRDAEKVFIAEGSKVVIDLLKSAVFNCVEILGLQESLQQNEIIIRKYYTGPLQVIEGFEHDKIAALQTPNQILAIFKYAALPAFNPKNKITLMLDTIQDPGNMGTIIRIADWFGIEAIICAGNCVDMYNPKVVQSTMGSLGNVKILYTDLLIWLKENKNIKTYAAALDGENVTVLKGLKEGIIVIGNEAKGISSGVMDMCSAKITIPKIGAAESLNAAVATGIILSHL